jgi:hypothetical protein
MARSSALPAVALLLAVALLCAAVEGDRGPKSPCPKKWTVVAAADAIPVADAVLAFINTAATYTVKTACTSTSTVSGTKYTLKLALSDGAELEAKLYEDATTAALKISELSYEEAGGDHDGDDR